MKQFKYNHNYLEYVAEKFSQKVLDILQKEILDTGILILTQDAKEKFVALLIANQKQLPDTLVDFQKNFGDTYIDFFMSDRVIGLLAIAFIGEVFKLEDVKEYTRSSLASAWKSWQLQHLMDNMAEVTILEKGQKK